MPETCIIIPCYNEEHRLPVRDFEGFIDSQPFSFCFVNDGSADGTVSVLNRLCEGREERVMVLDLRQNGGKAEAVRRGVQASLDWKPFGFVGYFDADLSTPLREIPYILSHFNDATDIAFGSRVKRLGTVIERNPARHYLGRVFSTFSSLILDIPVYDTQCGAKIFRSETARRIFAEPFLTRWLFDIELFGRMILESGHDSMGKRAIEVPLHQWVEVGKSKLKFSYLIKVPLELLRIRSYLLRKQNERRRAGRIKG